MSIGSFVVGFLLSVAVAYSLTRKYISWPKAPSPISDLIPTKKMTLEEAFGQPVNVDNFSLGELNSWVAIREKKLSANCKVLVAKANTETVKQLEKFVELDSNASNFLVIAIVNTVTNKKEESALIHYNKLDPNLEKMLDNGNGTLVIEA